jgi:hypothetical protein
LARKCEDLYGQAAAGLAYLAAVSQFGGFLVWYRSLAALGVPRASQLRLAQPLLTLVWSVLVLGERLPPAAPVAAAPVAAVAVIACIAVTQRTRSAAARDSSARGEVEQELVGDRAVVPVVEQALHDAEHRGRLAPLAQTARAQARDESGDAADAVV